MCNSPHITLCWTIFGSISSAVPVKWSRRILALKEDDLEDRAYDLEPDSLRTWIGSQALGACQRRAKPIAHRKGYVHSIVFSI